MIAIKSVISVYLHVLFMLFSICGIIYMIPEAYLECEVYYKYYRTYLIYENGCFDLTDAFGNIFVYLTCLLCKICYTHFILF